MKQLFAIFFIVALGLAGCGSAETTNPQTQGAEPKASGGTMSANPKVLIETSKGNITIELNAEKAPITVENFIGYVNDGFYNGTIFHRVIPNFMVQGGGMTADMSEKSTKASIQNEANNGLLNDRGTLAMARTNAPHSASSQFFINVADNAFLNFKGENPQGWGYAVFGKVTEGMEVVDAIVGVKTGNHGMHRDVPVEPVLMNKVSVVK